MILLHPMFHVMVGSVYERTIHWASAVTGDCQHTTLVQGSCMGIVLTYHTGPGIFVRGLSYHTILVQGSCQGIILTYYTGSGMLAGNCPMYHISLGRLPGDCPNIFG